VFYKDLERHPHLASLVASRYTQGDDWPAEDAVRAEATGVMQLVDRYAKEEKSPDVMLTGSGDTDET
jgi:hypothetical protein